MPTKYQVAPARSIYLPDNTLARQGQPLPTGIPKKLLKEWIASGFVVEQGASPAAAPSSPPVPSEGPLSQARQRVAPPKIKTNGKYTYSPADLEGKSLEELNLLLVDLDTDPADTEEEAIGILTSDFNGDEE